MAGGGGVTMTNGVKAKKNSCVSTASSAPGTTMSSVENKPKTIAGKQIYLFLKVEVGGLFIFI